MGSVAPKPALVRRPSRRSRSAARARGAVVVLVIAMGMSAPAAVASPAVVAAPGDAPPGAGAPWTWPIAGFRLDRAYVAAAHEYGPGHRGIDLRPLAGFDVLAPAGGTVAFSGDVAGRGILTIDHGDGLVTTFEPIDSGLEPGDTVARGAKVGVVALGGHAAPGAVHFGVRRDGEYVNPLLLLGGVPRAVLLPCC
ncbi:MAG: M23 family metallopeptidase [Microbacterium sp.]